MTLVIKDSMVEKQQKTLQKEKVLILIKKKYQTIWAAMNQQQTYLFRITQTDEVIKNNNITGEKNACNTRHMVGQAIRNTIIKIGGTTPEKLPTPEKSINEIEKEELKKLKDINF